jgi:GNAT superfamily N-acetyltransferase
VPVVARWLWEEFSRQSGRPLKHVQERLAASTAACGPPQTFVLLVDGEPVGTASLVAHDLDTRPDLTPWLAGVFVVPEARGRGHAARLIETVEAAGRAAAIPSLWLYTHAAERIYARAGWHTVEHFERCGRVCALMRREIDGSSAVEPSGPNRGSIPSRRPSSAPRP